MCYLISIILKPCNTCLVRGYKRRQPYSNCLAFKFRASVLTEINLGNNIINVTNLLYFHSVVIRIINYKYFQIYTDTIYTERYMGVPESNQLGYNNSDVTLQAEGLRDKRFLLIHGNADDNVHYQHSMQLARTLELLDIDFQSQVRNLI